MHAHLRAMGQKHPQRRAKRQRARAERRRVDVRRRQLAARARLQAVPRKPHDDEVPRDAPPPPPDDVLRPVQHAIDELRHGRGELAVDVRSWTPAESDAEPARIVLDLHLFGLSATVDGTIRLLSIDDLFDSRSPPAPGDADYAEWQSAAIARQVLAAVRADVDAARALVAFWALDELLVDELLFDRQLVVEVLRRLELGPELEDIFDPLIPALPEPLRELWQQDRDEWGGVADGVADHVLTALSWELSGTLVDLGEMIAGAALHSDWRPPWPTLNF